MIRKIIFTCLLVLAAALGARAADAEYSVSFIMGQAGVRVSGAADWTELAMNAQVALGDSLSTGAESRIELVAPDGSRVHINDGFRGALTPKLVAALTVNKPSSGLSSLMKTTSELEVQTPTAVAAVRGKASGDEPVTPLSEAELTDLLAAATEGTSTGEGSTDQENAAELLTEAISLRQQAGRLMQEDNLTAAEAALAASEDLVSRALALVGAEE